MVTLDTLNGIFLKLFPINDFKETSPIQLMRGYESDYENFAVLLKELGILSEVVEVIKYEYEKRIRQIITPQFWKFFETESIDYEAFQSSINFLSKVFKELNELIQLLKLMDPQKYSSTDVMFRSTLLSQISPKFNQAVLSYYSKAFSCFSSKYQSKISPSALFETS